MWCHFGSSHRWVVWRKAPQTLSQSFMDLVLWSGDVVELSAARSPWSWFPLCGILGGCLAVGWLCGWHCRAWCQRPVCRQHHLSPPRVGIKDFPFSPKQEWMHWWRHVLVGIIYRALYADLHFSACQVCRSAAHNLGSVGGRSGNSPRPAHSGDDARRGIAEGDSRLADPRGHSSYRWQSSADTGAKCHRGDPDGVGLESSQASHGSTGCGSLGDECHVHLYPQPSVGRWDWRVGRHRGGLHFTSSPPAKKVKISSVLDQTDETEVTLKSRAELVKYFENHPKITGSEPMPEVERTDIQVAAMEEKVVVRDESPYADFSILTPFGRRMQKTMKMKSYAFQPDGSWKTAEIPGPPNLQAWQACFKVYRAVLYMLRYPGGTTTSPPTTGGPVGLVTKEPVVVQPHSLELYFESFMELCLEYPECWHLLMPAEDRMRGERFEHLRRNLARAHAAGKVPVDIEYDPARITNIGTPTSEDPQWFSWHVLGVLPSRH